MLSYSGRRKRLRGKYLEAIIHVVSGAVGVASNTLFNRLRMRLLLLHIFVSIMASAPSLSMADVVSDSLYSGAIAVEDQSVTEQRRAIPLALDQVLQKLTGLRDLEEFPELDQVLNSAQSMVVTFYYRKAKLTLPDGSQQDQLWLLVNFSQTAVDDLVQTMQLSLWSPDRKPLTVWLLVDDGSSRRIMPIELEYVWEQIAAISDGRGMPLIRPRPDAEGNYPVDTQLLWGGYTEELAEAGPVDALVIAARRDGPEWNVRMNLEYGGQQWSWRNRDSDIQSALAEGMHRSIDEIVAINSIAAADQGQLQFQITVAGLVSAEDYVRCMSYLQGLSLVDHVTVEKAQTGRVRFGLTLNALPDYLLNTLESGNILASSSTEGEYFMLP